MFFLSLFCRAFRFMRLVPINGEAVKTECGKTPENHENKGENDDFDRSIFGQIAVDSEEGGMVVRRLRLRVSVTLGVIRQSFPIDAPGPRVGQILLDLFKMRRITPQSFRGNTRLVRQHSQPATGEIEWMQTWRFRMGSSSSGFSSTDSLKILLPSSPV
jgi:hypothetical protein